MRELATQHPLRNIKAYYTGRIRRETRAIQEGIKKFNTYFLSYLIGEVSPEVFSVFGLIHRTNNLVESWHSGLNKPFLKETENLKVRDFEAESADRRSTRPKPIRQRKRDEFVEKNEHDFIEGTISLREFLRISRNLTEPDHDARSRMDSNDSSNSGTPDQERPAVRPRRRFLAGSVRAVLPPPPPAEVHQPAAEVQQPNAEVQLPAAEVQTRPVRRRNSPRVTRVPHHLSDDGDSPITRPTRRPRLNPRP
ncbi:hypothetical protein OUZ56_017021 [Daphnia magna]|uniref:Uncharacterized protein n=1 Tax=Daphnia magna TaxID=35525 RepID=A0ABR0AS33_9CRUS|nr:hypothetical protein OUZ56_017021 [Daphnia magna]